MNTAKIRIFRIGILIILIAAIIFGGIIISRNVAAAAAAKQERYYTSIELKSGDSLWSIASAYHGDESVSDYVDELRKINNIINDEGLIAGRYLTIYYYN